MPEHYLSGKEPSEVGAELPIGNDLSESEAKAEEGPESHLYDLINGYYRSGIFSQHIKPFDVSLKSEIAELESEMNHIDNERDSEKIVSLFKKITSKYGGGFISRLLLIIEENFPPSADIIREGLKRESIKDKTKQKWSNN